MRFSIAPDHPCLPGHFPGQPVVPAVIVLDRVCAAIEALHGPLGALQLPQVKFLAPLLPGQCATIELQGSAERLRFRVWRDDDGVLLASGELARA